MNWGTKITIVMLCFMTMIGTYAYLMMTSKSDELVDKDYYEKGINYDVDYNKKENVKLNHMEPSVLLRNDSIVVTFPAAAYGILKLIRTADKKMDQSFRLETDLSNQFLIATPGKGSGLWKLQVDWTTSGTTYLYEKEVMLP
jgi:hypothetical protein